MLLYDVNVYLMTSVLLLPLLFVFIFLSFAPFRCIRLMSFRKGLVFCWVSLRLSLLSIVAFSPVLFLKLAVSSCFPPCSSLFDALSSYSFVSLALCLSIFTYSVFLSIFYLFPLFSSFASSFYLLSSCQASSQRNLLSRSSFESSSFHLVVTSLLVLLIIIIIIISIIIIVSFYQPN